MSFNVVSSVVCSLNEVLQSGDVGDVDLPFAAMCSPIVEQILWTGNTFLFFKVKVRSGVLTIDALGSVDSVRLFSRTNIDRQSVVFDRIIEFSKSALIIFKESR